MNIELIAIDKTKREQVIVFLKDSRLFAHFPVEILGELVPLSTITEYSKGTEILYEGQKDNTRIFFILEGSVNIHAGGEFILKLQRKGDIFGEMGVITEKPSSASVVADTDLKVLTMNTKDIGPYKDSDSSIYQHIIYRVFSMILADKLTLTTQKAQQFESTNRILTDQAQELVAAKLELDLQFMTSLRMEKKLAESEDRYRKLFNNAQVGLFRTKIESGEILECNQYIVDIFGYDTPEEVKKAIKSLEIYANKVDRENMLIELAKEGEIVQKPMLFKKKDGTIFWGSYSINIFNDQGFIEGVLVDITEQKMAENLLNKAHLELGKKVEERTVDYKRAKKEAEIANQSKSDFLSNMSHEIRTPMHQILSYSKFGVDKIDKVKKEKLHHYFSKIGAIGQNLLSLLNDLLDLSKLESGKMNYDKKMTHLQSIISNIIGEFHSLIEEKGIILEKNIASFISVINCDELKIGQVVRNLISNAIKFTPSGKKLSVLANSSEFALNSKNLVPVLLITISDQGVGIPDDELESVFDKFIQSSKTKTNAGGTGLGLAICKEIIQAHNGKIWAENNSEGGATFSFMLPYEKEVK
jgi:PAS domain S-box-containing protein